MKKIGFAFLLNVIIVNTVVGQSGVIISTYKLNAENETAIAEPSSTIFYGYGMCNLGDFNKDGVDDLALAAGETITSDGILNIMFMNSDGTIKSKSVIGKNKGGLNSDIPNDFERFGRGVSPLGDIDGDGIDDIAVGNDNPSFGGELFILFMNTDGTVKDHTRIASGKNGFNTSIPSDGRFGYKSVCNIGDLDGDGIPEVAVGDISDDDGGVGKGAIYILFLKSDGTVKQHQKISEITGNFSGVLGAGSSFGSSITNLGKKRIAVGAERDTDGQDKSGSVWIIDLDNEGKVIKNTKITEGLSGFTESLPDIGFFGCAVANVGDIDGDDINDMAVGAEWIDDVNAKSGAVFLLFMNADGTVKSHLRYGNSHGNLGYTLDADSYFGSALAGMGDWNGDGKYDIVVGARNIMYEGVPKGEIHILHIDGKDQKIGVNNISLSSINIYPNPANKSIKIDNTNLTNANYRVTIFDVTGRQVLVQNSNAIKQQEINIETLEEGMYHILITTDDNCSYQSKLVVQH